MTELELEAALEKLVDQNRLTGVLIALGGVCQTKAQHIAHNWQDKSTAKLWENIGVKLDKFTNKTVQPFGSSGL